MMRGVKAPVQAVSVTDRNTVAVCLVWAVALLASGIAPYDRLTWLMEVLPVLIAAPVLVATRGRLPLTSLVYALIAVHGRFPPWKKR